MARKQKERYFELSIYLIKAGVTDHAQIVPTSPSLDSEKLKNGRKTLGTLYVKYEPRGEPPRWTQLMRGGVSDGFLDRLKPRTVSAVLLIEQDRRVFALTFGYGHTLVDPDHVVSDFGLKTTLNSADPDAIRQVDRRRLDSTGRIAVEQSGRPIPFHQFGLDIEQDLVRRVTARPRDPALGRQLSGKEALRANVPATLENINELLSRYLAVSQETTYLENFAFIDNIKEIRDEALIHALRTEVVRLANDDAASDVWMAPPDVIEWTKSQGLRYTDDPDEEPRPDVDLIGFRAVVLGRDPVTWTALEKCRISVIGNDDNVSDSWPVYKCLYAELEHAGHNYVLTEGKWYLINDDFAHRVVQNFAAIRDCDLELPRWIQKNEGRYNVDTAADSHGELHLMDTKLIHFPTPSDKMEFCDLLSSQRHLIHVKQFTSSSGMSHLCAQASNSAEYLRMDRDFRALVNTKMQELHLPDACHVPMDFTTADAARYEVVFAIADKHGHQPIEIPFFSKVSICHAARRCEGFGFRVSKKKIVKDNLG